MAQLLDHTQATEIAESIEQLQDELGYTTEEMIPGLVQGIIKLANQGGRSSNDFDQLLDEASNLLADGGINDDD